MTKRMGSEGLEREDMEREQRSGVLVGGRDPDEVFAEGERKTKEREARERHTPQAAVQRIPVETIEPAPTVPPTGTNQTSPPSPQPPQSSPSNGFDIQDCGAHFVIKGVPYTSGNPWTERLYTVELCKEVLLPGDPMDQAFWARSATEKIRSLASDPTIDYEWYAASAPFYMAVFRALRNNQSIKPWVVNEARLCIRRNLEHRVMTLTSITYTNVLLHDHATHNTGTYSSNIHVAVRDGRLGKRLTGPDGDLFSLGEEGGLSKVLFGMSAGVAADLFAWILYGGTSSQPAQYSYLQRRQRGPLLFSTNYPLTLNMMETPIKPPTSSSTPLQSAVHIACNKEDGVGNPIGLRIYDDKRRVVLP